MVYIGADGNVVGPDDKRSKSIRGFITDMFAGIVGFLGLLFGTVTGNPNRIQVRKYKY